MSDIIDIVQRLTYDVQTGGLDKAYQAIEKNISAVAKNAESVQRLEALKERTDSRDIARINQINVALENRRKAITRETQEISKQIQVNDRLKVSLLNTFGTYDVLIKKQRGLAASSNTANSALIDLGRVAQDLPFGFIGIQNNIAPVIERFGQLVAETGSTSAALKGLQASLVGVGGLGFAFSIITSALTFYALKSQSAGTATRNLSEEIQKATQSLDGLLEKLNEQRFDAGIFGTDRIKELRREIDELKEKSGTEEQVFQKEQTLRGLEIGRLKEVKAAYESLRTVTQSGQSSAEFRQQIEETIPFASKQQVDEIIKNVNAGGTLYTIANQRISDINEDIRDKESDSRANSNRRQTTIQDQANDANEKALKKAQEQAEAYEAILDAFKKATINDAKEVDRIQNEIDAKAKESATIFKELKDSFGKTLEADLVVGIKNTDPGLRGDILRQQAQKEADENEKKREKESEARRETNIKKTISAYVVLENAITNILNNIYERQVELLDLELDRRRQNIGYAVELAERGNVQLLNSERERITELEKDRERAAARQIQLNSLIAASNSALAVTQAIRGVLTAATTTAEEGGGIIGFIASLIAGAAAVAGLYTALRAANDANSGFKDGEVDIQGPGTTTSDSIPARISKGESVINAASTAKYKPLLEAINAGTFDASRYHGYTAVMAQPQKQVAYLSDKQMAELMEAFQGGQVNVKQSLDSAGFSQQVETYSRRERARFNH